MEEQNDRTPDQIELAKWLLLRSDQLRASYGNRAMLVLTADAMLVGSAIIVLQEGYSDPSLSTAAALGGILILVTLSIAFAFLATGTLKQNSRRATGCDGPERVFLSPADSQALLISFDAFREKFLALDERSVLSVLLSELQMDLVLQGRRYNHLKTSIVLFLASLAVFVTFVIVFHE